MQTFKFGWLRSNNMVKLDSLGRLSRGPDKLMREKLIRQKPVLNFVKTELESYRNDKVKHISTVAELSKKFNFGRRAITRWLSENLSPEERSQRQRTICQQEIAIRYCAAQPIEHVCEKCGKRYLARKFGYFRKYCDYCILEVKRENSRRYEQLSTRKSKRSVYFRSKKYKDLDKKRNKNPIRREKRRLAHLRYNHTEKAKILNKNWRKNTEKGKQNVIFNNMRRRERLAKVRRGYTKAQWSAKYNEAKSLGFCPKCNQPYTEGARSVHQLTMDHDPPLNKVQPGFNYTINEIKPLCFSCNSSKQDRI